MNFFRNNISAVILGFAVFGIMLSMLHYHSEGLQCLTHANEQHYTQNELLCPAAGIVAVTAGEFQSSLDGLMKFHDSIIDIQPLYLSAQPFVPLLGRAPPTLT